MTTPPTPAGSLAGEARILDLLSAHANDDADAIAFRTDDGMLRRADLVERVGRLAAGLIDHGIGPGVVVGLRMPNALDHIVTALALLCTGAEQLCLPSYETDDTNRKLMAIAGVSRVVAPAPMNWVGNVPTLDMKALSGTPFRDNFPGVPLETPAAIRRTSGSTGIPKLMRMSLERIVSMAERRAANPAFAGTLHIRSVEFDQTAMFGYGAALGGTLIVHTAGASLETMADLVARHDITTVYLAGYHLNALLRAVGSNPSPMPADTRLLIHGERVSGALRSEVQAALTRNLWVSYGASEVGPVASAGPEDHADHPDGVGHPVGGATVEIVDDTGAELPSGVPGQIRIRAPGMADGYIGDPVATAARFREGWFYPGDVMVREADGTLTFRGRSDHIINLNGIKIDPGAIEDALAAHSDVVEAAAFAVPSAIHGSVPAAAIVLGAGASSRDPETYLDYCRDHLGVRGPRRIVILDALPRNAAGKIDRQSLLTR